MRRLLVCLLTMVAIASAQTERGRIAGTIYDVSGAVVQHAQVTITNQNTDAARQVTADEKGHYDLEDLLPAPYQLTANASGFAINVLTFTLATGQNRALDVHLQPTAVKETVEVVSGLSQVDTSSASMASTISGREVDSLPLNGRHIAQLYLLTPGASSTGAGTFGDIRFAGRSNEQNTARTDGIDSTSIIDSNPGCTQGAGGGVSNFRLVQSLESVQEFNVQSSNYAAEYGRGTGGQIDVVTKSGSNRFHGDAFEYLRNDVFDSRNYFLKPGAAAPLRLNQFGGSFGGPIVKDKLFFYASNENLLQRVAVAYKETTLSSLARSEAVPSIQPLLAAYPVGQTHTADPLLDIVSGTNSSYVNEYYGNLRLDYHINSKNNAYFRYMRDQGESSDPSDLTSGKRNTMVPQNAVADLTTVLGPNLINDLKIGFNAMKGRYIIQGETLPGLDLSNVAISIGGGTQSGSTGMITPTGAGSAPLSHAQDYTTSEMEYIDNLSWTRGNHTIKTGIEITPRVMYMDQLGGAVYTYSTVSDFLINKLKQVQVASDLDSFPSPFNNGYTGVRKGLQTFYGGYIQDEWRIKPNLTMNYGLRYDYFTPLTEAHNLGVGVDTNTGQLLTGKTPFYASSKTNFGPRLAFAWSPKALHNKTVIRIGGGLYYGPGQEEDQVQSILNDYANITYTQNSVPSGYGTLAYPANRLGLITAFNPNAPNALYQPRVYQDGYTLPERVASYTLSVQQTLPDQSVLTVAYVGSQTRHAFSRGVANLITGVATDPVTGAAIITRQFGNQYAELDFKGTNGRANYNSLQLSWNRRFAKGFTAVANYTWAKSLGSSDGSNEATTAENNYTTAGEYGPNSSDIRHSFNLALLWDLPFGKSHTLNFADNRWLNTAFGGWQVGTSFNARTGTPINVLCNRPDVLYKYTGSGKYNGQYYTSPVFFNGTKYSSSHGAGYTLQTVAVDNLPGGGSSRGTQRPDEIAGVDPYLSAGNGYYLNPAAFSVPLPGTYGNEQRDTFYGAGFNQVDLSLTKQFSIRERTKLEFRADAYNILNHPNIANPGSLILGSATPSGPTSTTASLQPGQVYTASTAGSAFGLQNSTVSNYIGMGTSRQIQLSMRLLF